ncbi:signal transduction histidine kinase [Paenibacillus sp. DS2015]|uniref:GAF domain-containing sensor histidine kinase n=1 Tax=Paenibacillus sp. DS2015 TaxID=3373917 RepID=UPI003D201B45
MGDEHILKTDFVDVLSIISNKLYVSAATVMETASKMMPANTFCIANLDSVSTKVLKVHNRSKVIIGEGLVIDNKESYCALVTEHAQGPLIIDNNLTHPLTKSMDATPFVGGCSFLGVPIIKEDGEVYGSLCAFDHEYYQYQEKDVELLLSLSTFFSTLLELEVTVQQLRTAEETTANMLEEKSNLLAVLSHEIRTPMNGVLGMASLLHSSGLTPEQTEYVNVVEKSSSSLISMMDTILEYSKIKAGKLELESSPFNIREDLSHVLQLFSAESLRKGLRLFAEFDSVNDPILIGDSHKIRQILTNLISNSLKFTERGEISIAVGMVTTQRDTVEVTFEVRDTGVGIPADRKDRLFRSFSQVHDAETTGKYKGTGLGLSICKQLAELMGGEVWLKNSNTDGSQFVFKVTLKQLKST